MSSTGMMEIVTEIVEGLTQENDQLRDHLSKLITAKTELELLGKQHEELRGTLLEMARTLLSITEPGSPYRLQVRHARELLIKTGPPTCCDNPDPHFDHGDIHPTCRSCGTNGPMVRHKEDPLSGVQD